MKAISLYYRKTEELSWPTYTSASFYSHLQTVQKQRLDMNKSTGNMQQKNMKHYV